MKGGWEIKKLGSLCSVNRDSGIHSDMPYLGMENIGSGNGMVISDGDISCVVGTTNLFRKGDVLYGKLRPYLKKVVVAEYDGCCSTEIVPLKCNDRLYPDYLKYWFLEDSTSDRINATCGGCRMPRANMKDVLQFDIPITTLTEQQRIVNVLDAEFEKIDRLRSNAEQNLRHAKDLFQAAQRVELEPKEGWKRIKLKEISAVRVGPFGSSLHKNDYISGGTPLINPIHMKDGVIVPSSDFSVSNSKLRELSNYILKEGDIVFARRGEIGRCALVSQKEDGYLCGTGSLFVRFNSPQNSSFMMNLLDSPVVKEQLLSHAAGATMLNINNSTVENLEVCLPPKEAQSKIQNTLCLLRNRCKVLQDNYTKTIALCDDLKQALLRKAFNGEL